MSHSQRLSMLLHRPEHKEACILFGRGPRYRRLNHGAILLWSQARALSCSSLRSVSPSASFGDSKQGRSLRWETWHGLFWFKLKLHPVLTVCVLYHWSEAFSVLLRSIRRDILPGLLASEGAPSYSHAQATCVCPASQPDKCTHCLQRSLPSHRTSYIFSQFVGPWTLTSHILWRGSALQFASKWKTPLKACVWRSCAC